MGGMLTANNGIESLEADCFNQQGKGRKIKIPGALYLFVSGALLAVGNGMAQVQINPAISVQGTNATLVWASTPGQNFVILHRESLDVATPWTVLQSTYPAHSGSSTYFVHTGGVLIPAGGTGGGGGGGAPPIPSASSLTVGGDTTAANDKGPKPGRGNNGDGPLDILKAEREFDKWLREYLRRLRKGESVESLSMPSGITAMSASASANPNDPPMGYYAVLDGAEDVNGDGVPDGLAAVYGINPLLDQTLEDTDGDGLSNQEEIVAGSNPTVADTDGDGATDADEIWAGSDPLTPLGLPGVSLAYHEYFYEYENYDEGGTNYIHFRFEWGNGAAETNRNVHEPAANGEIGSTTTTEWQSQFAQLKPGTQTSWIDLQGGGQTNIVITTNIALPTGPYATVWLNGVIDGVTNVSQVQYVSPGTNSALKRVYEVTLTGQRGTNFSQMQTITNFSGISIAGQALNTNGRCWVVIGDNTRTNLTPAFPAGATNVAFNLTVAPVVIQITMRTTGLMTKPDNVPPVGTGYDAALRADFVTQIAEALGGPLFINKPAVGIVGFVNAVEFNSTVPFEMPTDGWKWHRDANVKRFLWNSSNQITTTIQNSVSLTFTGAPPGNGNDYSPPQETLEDLTPDINRLILNADAPSLDVLYGDNTSEKMVNAPDGSFGAMRLYAREWITWHGGVASVVFKWHSFLTIQKGSVNSAPSFTPQGANAIGPTGANDIETPAFSVDGSGNPQ